MKNVYKKFGKVKISIAAMLLGLLITSCEDFIKIDPPKTEVVSDAVFSSDATSLSAVSGIYSMMMSNVSFTDSYLELYTGTSADELTSYSTSDLERQFYLNSLVPLNSAVQSIFWQEPYKYIFNANVAIEELEKSTTVSDKAKMQLVGEAKFIRAFCYFYLTNLFGDVPLITSSDYRINSTTKRHSSALVYQQIIQDLLIAQTQLTEDFVSAAGERVRPTRWAATALLSRVYLYAGDWTNAEIQATNVIKSSLFTLLTDLKSVFLKNSLETIWQLKPVITGSALQQSKFILTIAPGPPPAPSSVALTNNLIMAIEPGDKRRTDWVGSLTTGGTTYYYPFKYKNNTSAITEYNTILRLSEQYLIRAEARTQQSDIVGGLTDLNIIRTRAGLANRITVDKNELLSFIEKERRIELFTEGGHRWLDLKRMNKASFILKPIKANWDDTDVLYPIPQTEINVNPALLPQNSGY